MAGVSRHVVGIVDRDRGWKALLKSVESMAGGSYAKVGVLADDAKGGLHVPGADLTVAEIAAVHEWGTEDGHIPARPFLGPTFDKQRDELVKMSAQGIVKILDGKMTVGQVLGILGAKLATETKKYITTTPLPGVGPPNAPSTALAKAKKGRTKRLFKREAATLGDALAQAGALASVRTLVDTGRMVNAITWVVVQGAFGQGLQGWKAQLAAPDEGGTASGGTP